MRLPSLLVCVCLLAAVSSAARTRRQSDPLSCQDFAGRSGTCGPIQECPAFFNLISGGRRPSSEEIARLRESQCGANGTDGAERVLVCCALPPAGPFNGPPDQHPNRALLERGVPCGATLVTRIAGGMEVRLGEYPWVALLGYSNLSTGEVTYVCSGALISQQHVLTAAHCVIGLPAGLRLETVRLGDHNLSLHTDCATQHGDPAVCNAPQELPIVELSIHGDYNKPTVRLNDIALLKLERPVIEDDFVGKICLPFGAARLRDYTGVNMTAAGFGRVGPGRDSPASEVLLAVQLPGVEQQQCADMIRVLGGTLGPRQLCAGGEQGRDVCFGDSGAPLVAEGEPGEPFHSLVGVVAYGASECDGQVPSVFTRVSAYLNWILDRIGD